MTKIIDSVLEFFANKTHSFGTKSLIVFSSIVLVLLVDYNFGFSNHFDLNNRLTTIDKIEGLKIKYPENKALISFLNKTEKKIMFKNHFFSFFLGSSDKSLHINQRLEKITPNNQKSNKKTIIIRSSFWHCDEYLKEYHSIDNYNLAVSITDEIVERGWGKPSNYSNTVLMIKHEGEEIMKKYGSYSSFLYFEKKSHNKKTMAKTAKTVIPIGIAMFSIIVNIIFGWLNYSENKKIDSLSWEIDKLKSSNDSFVLENNKYKNIISDLETRRTLGKNERK